MNIRNQRHKWKVSQLELCHRTGMSRFRLFLIENGYKKPTAEEKMAVADFFHMLESSPEGAKIKYQRRGKP